MEQTDKCQQERGLGDWMNEVKSLAKKQGPAEVRLAWMCLVGCMNVLNQMDRNLNISPKMSYSVLECDIVMLQNYMFMILLWETFACRAPHLPRMKISLPRHDLFGEEKWPISQRRMAKSLFLNGLLLGSVCTETQVKLINHCQAVRIKQ